MNSPGKAFLKRSGFFAAMFGFTLAVFVPARTIAQGTLSTIISNGPTAKRINLVVLSEGYKTNQLATFLVDATNAVNYLLNQQPYQEYRNYFNAFAISVASVDSGSDHPTQPLFVNTYFNSIYEFGNYVITIPPNSYDSDPAHGQGKVNTLLTNLLPEYDLAVLLVNDGTAGGSGGTGGTKQFITALNKFGPAMDIITHESGHALGNLADEYDTANPGYPTSERANATAQTNRALIKWTSWIATNTPLPTPEDPTNASVVGLFQGAEYQTTGWYRPKLTCKMNTHLGTPFCEVCTEQLVKSIYQLSQPIDSFSPLSTNFSIYSTQAISFSVTPLQPATHDLTIQWYTNNVAVNGATNFTFQLLPQTFPNGTNRLRAVVHDPTSMVRNDPTNVLSATNTWTLNISLNELSLISAQYLSASLFRMTVTGAAPQGFVIQASTNLSSWVSLTTNNLSGGKYDYTNSGLTNPYRYYRTRSPP